MINPTSSQDEGQNPLQYNQEKKIQVEIVIPHGTNRHYTGYIKVVNLENQADYCDINVDIITSKTKDIDFNLMRILNKLILLF